MSVSVQSSPHVSRSSSSSDVDSNILRRLSASVIDAIPPEGDVLLQEEINALSVEDHADKPDLYKMKNDFVDRVEGQLPREVQQICVNELAGIIEIYTYSNAFEEVKNLIKYQPYSDYYRVSITEQPSMELYPRSILTHNFKPGTIILCASLNDWKSKGSPKRESELKEKLDIKTISYGIAAFDTKKKEFFITSAGHIKSCFPGQPIAFFYNDVSVKDQSGNSELECAKINAEWCSTVFERDVKKCLVDISIIHAPKSLCENQEVRCNNNYQLYEGDIDHLKGQTVKIVGIDCPGKIVQTCKEVGSLKIPELDLMCEGIFSVCCKENTAIPLTRPGDSGKIVLWEDIESKCSRVIGIVSGGIMDNKAKIHYTRCSLFLTAHACLKDKYFVDLSL